MKLAKFLILLFILCVGNPVKLYGQNVPKWAKGVIRYQIFPERFHIAGISNDSTAERINAPKGWEILSWTGD